MVYFDPTERDYAFQLKTTYLNDYKKYERQEETAVRGKIYSEVHEKPSAPQRHVDQETLAEYKHGACVPFTLFHIPKPILQPQPYELEIFDTPIESENSEVIKTRPRMYKSPAVPFDNIEDHEKRDTVMNFIYKTDWETNAEPAALPKTKRERVNPNEMGKSMNNSVQLKIEMYNPLTGPFLRRSRQWDDNQHRYIVDPTAMFWIHKDPPVKCGACVNPLENILPNETKQTIANLIKEDKLRGEHDHRCSSYMGYIPNYTDPVPLAKTEFPISYPFMTLSQTIDLRKKDKTGHMVTYE